MRPRPQTKFIEGEQIDFNTPLSPVEEGQFLAWYRQVSANLQLPINPDDSSQYYDYRGYWKDNQNTIPNEKNYHFVDTYKKPGHPTFAEGSKYSAQQGGSNIYGGKWEGKHFVHSKDTDLHAAETEQYIDNVNKMEGTEFVPVYEGENLPMQTVKPKYKNSGSVSVQKAKKILSHGYIRGRKLTEKQKLFFGAAAEGRVPYDNSGNVRGTGYAHTHANPEDAVGHPEYEKKIDVTGIVGGEEEIVKRKTNLQINTYGSPSGLASNVSMLVDDDRNSTYDYKPQKINRAWKLKMLTQGKFMGDIGYLSKNELNDVITSELKDDQVFNDWVMTPAELAMLRYYRTKGAGSADGISKAKSEDIKRFEKQWCPEGSGGKNPLGCLGSANRAYDLKANQYKTIKSSMELKADEGIMSISKADLAKYAQDSKKIDGYYDYDSDQYVDGERDIAQKQLNDGTIDQATYDGLVEEWKVRKENEQKDYRTYWDNIAETHPYLSNEAYDVDQLGYGSGASADSWTIAGAYIKAGQNRGLDLDQSLIYNRMNVYDFDKTTGDILNPGEYTKYLNHDPLFEMTEDGEYVNKEKIEELWSKIPVGAVASMGHAYGIETKDQLKQRRSKTGLRGNHRPNYNAEALYELGKTPMGFASHSMEAVAYTPAGEPIFYDGFFGPMPTLDAIDQATGEGTAESRNQRGYFTFTELLLSSGYELEGITAPPGAIGNTFKSLSERGLAHDIASSYDTTYVRSLANALETDEGGDKNIWGSHTENINVPKTQEFVDSLGLIKGIMKNMTGMSDKAYDMYADMAVTLGLNESSGMGGSTLMQILQHPNIDARGDTQGFTQLNMNNITGTYGPDDHLVQIGKKEVGDIKDDLLYKRYQELNRKWLTETGKPLDIQDPKGAAALTMIYISEGSKRAEEAWKKGLSPGVRTFNEPTLDQIKKNIIKDPISAISPLKRHSGSGSWNNEGFHVDGTDVRVNTDDYLRHWQLSNPSNAWKTPEYRAQALQNELNDVYIKNSSHYKGGDGIFVVNLVPQSEKERKENMGRDKFSITKKTRGNSPDLTPMEKLDYYWQSPNALATGDAEGKSSRVINAKKNFENIQNLRKSGEKIGDQEKIYTQSGVDYAFEKFQQAKDTWNGFTNWISGDPGTLTEHLTENKDKKDRSGEVLPRQQNQEMFNRINGRESYKTSGEVEPIKKKVKKSSTEVYPKLQKLDNIDEITEYYATDFSKDMKNMSVKPGGGLDYFHEDAKDYKDLKKDEGTTPTGYYFDNATYTNKLQATIDTTQGEFASRDNITDYIESLQKPFIASSKKGTGYNRYGKFDYTFKNQADLNKFNEYKAIEDSLHKEVSKKEGWEANPYIKGKYPALKGKDFVGEIEAVNEVTHNNYTFPVYPSNKEWPLHITTKGMIPFVNKATGETTKISKDIQGTGTQRANTEGWNIKKYGGVVKKATKKGRLNMGKKK